MSCLYFFISLICLPLHCCSPHSLLVSTTSPHTLVPKKMAPFGKSKHGTTVTSDGHKDEYDLSGMETNNTVMTTFDAIGGNDERNLWRDGKLVLMPAPTQDPRDPLNLPLRRKILAVLCISCFGALAASAELILGAMLPVFALQYANIDPKFLLTLTNAGGLPLHSDPLKYLAQLPNIPPIWKVYLLASMPILIIGLANLVFIPLAIAIGRRSVLLAAGVIAIGGAVWAGQSDSLESHIGARCVQAIGAGTVESLIPFIIQDLVHVHQRNTWIAGAFTAQGVIIIALGIGSPYMIINLDWRCVYYMTAIIAALFLVAIAIFLPETRWHRTRDEMSKSGLGRDPSTAADNASTDGVPRDESRHVREKRTWKYDLALRRGHLEWKKGWIAFADTVRTFFFPHIFFITMLDSAMIAAALAAGYTASPALITAPWTCVTLLISKALCSADMFCRWNFYNLGLCLIPVLIGAGGVFILTGFVADRVANALAKKSGTRIPENQLINLALPTICALVGSILFGITGDHQDQYHWAVFLLGLGLMAFGFLGGNSIGAVYVLECYPHMAGPALMNIAAVRCIIAFLLSFKVSEWVADLGYENTFIIYIALMGFFALLMPLVYFFGPSWRRCFPVDRYQ